MKLLKKILGSDDDNEIDELVAEYKMRVSSGEKVNRSAFIADHPDIAVELNQALESAISTGGGDRPPTADPEFTAAAVSVTTEFRSGIYDVMLNAEESMAQEFGPYRVEALIGQGAMGRVYMAWEDRRQRYVAIKTMHPEFQDSESKSRRLGREGLAQSRLDHPNIVKIFDAGTTDGIPYLAMEFIDDGTTVQTLIQESPGPLNARRVAEIILPVASALSYSHQQGVVHRDIKPSNIMMQGDTPKLTDFGLAYIRSNDLSRLTQSGELLGTLCYMAPEQVSEDQGTQDQPIPASDIYSLGATLYESLTGIPPFQSEYAGRLIRRILEDDPLPPAKVGAELNKDIEAICFKCLEKSPSDRYASAADLADDLSRFLAGKPVNAPHINWPVRRLRGKFRRRRVVAGAALLATASVALAIWAATHLRYQDRLSILRDHQGYPPATGTDYSIPFLLKALKDDDPEARICAVTALSRRNDPEGNRALIEAARDTDPKVQFHLASAMLDSLNAEALTICEILIQADDGYVAAAAIKLATSLGDRSLDRHIRKHTFSKDRLLRKYAIRALMDMLRRDNEEFVADYLRRGPADARAELLELLRLGQYPPPLHALIQALQSERSNAELEVLSQILQKFTNENYGTNYNAWNGWWQQFGQRWRARRCLLVAWAPKTSSLKTGDIIMAVDGEPLSDTSQIFTDETVRLAVYRRGELQAFTGVTGALNSRDLYFGTIDGDFVENFAGSPSQNSE